MRVSAHVPIDESGNVTQNKETGRPRVSKLAFARYRLSLIGQGSMGKVIAAAAATMAFAPFSVVATTPGVAQAAPCAGVEANPESCEDCMFYVTVFDTENVCYEAAPSRPAQAPPSRVPVPVPIPEAPPEPAPPTYASPSTVPMQTPQVVPSTPPPPSTISVQSPKINPLAPAAPAAQTPEPSQPTEPWWPQELLYGVLAIAVGLVAWMINRPDTERGSDR
jgi:hypothetical protein